MWAGVELWELLASDQSVPWPVALHVDTASLKAPLLWQAVFVSDN